MSKARTLADKAVNGRKNLIINGNLDIWQRHSSSNVSGGYVADRWYSTNGNGDQTTFRQAFQLGQSDVPNEPEYLIRMMRTVASTIASNVLAQRVEGVRSLSGQVATLSFWAKAATSKVFNVAVAQSFGTGGSPSPTNYLPLIPVSVTTSWKKFTVTLDIPSIAGKTIGSNRNDYLQVSFQETSGFSVFTLDIAQVQLEKGNVATDFEIRPIGEEKLLCDRFFQRVSNVSLSGSCRSASQIYACASLSAEMRAEPSVTLTGPLSFSSNGNFAQSSAQINIFNVFSKGFRGVFENFAGLTSGFGACGNGGASVELDAEL